MKTIDILSLPISTDAQPRKIRVLLPDNYDPIHKKYPVVYMHDGQNLFEDQTAYALYSWGIYETLCEVNLNENYIIVGIDNSDLRLFEYAPWKSGALASKFIGTEAGGLGAAYADFVVHQVKPFIDSSYATLPSREHTMIAGSSMGAYISVYIGLRHPNIFSTVGSFSLASWFNEPPFLKFIDAQKIDVPMRFFVSVGTLESKDPDMAKTYVKNSETLIAYLKKKEGIATHYMLTEDRHHEQAWRKLFKSFILWQNKDAH